MIWGNGNGAVGYLLDITIVETNPYVPPFSPIFSTAIATDVFINLSKSSDFVTYQLPSAYNVVDETKKITVTVNNMKSFMTYNSADNTIVIDVSTIPAGSFGTYTIVILLEDDDGNTSKFTVVFHVYDDVESAAVEVTVVEDAEKLRWDE